MVERRDLIALHEPMERIAYVGPLEIESERFESPETLMEWLLDGSTRIVFLKETITPPVLAAVVANERFLAGVHHAFLIRTPAEVAASFYAVEGNMRIMDTGFEALHELYVTVQKTGGQAPIVIDSGELIAQPEAMMRSYCEAVDIPFIADALTWQPGPRPEWQHAPRWHTDVSASSGFVRPTTPDNNALGSRPEVAEFVARHRAFYDSLYAERLRITEADD